jgi:mannose-1-phosphate guanylyltransferase
MKGVKQAVIMVGGRGTRLQPLTDTRPKPALPVVDVPCLKYLIRSFADAGITEILLACGYRSEYLENAVGDGSDLGVTIEYSVEDHPLGTAGAMKRLESRLDEVFCAANGDTFADLDLKGLIEDHIRTGASVTMALTETDRPTECGIVRLEADGEITEFKEKPKPEEVFSNLINAGVYVVNRSVLAYVPEDTFSDFNKDTFPAIMSDGGRLQGRPLEGRWMDVGRPKDLIAVNLLMAGETGKGPGRISCDTSGNVFAGAGSTVSGGSMESSVVLRGSSVVDTHLLGSLVMENCKVTGADIRDSILGEGCTVGAAKVTDSVIAPGTVIPDGAVVKDRKG